MQCGTMEALHCTNKERCVLVKVSTVTPSKIIKRMIMRHILLMILMTFNGFYCCFSKGIGAKTSFAVFHVFGSTGHPPLQARVSSYHNSPVFTTKTKAKSGIPLFAFPSGVCPPGTLK